MYVEQSPVVYDNHCHVICCSRTREIKNSPHPVVLGLRVKDLQLWEAEVGKLLPEPIRLCRKLLTVSRLINLCKGHFFTALCLQIAFLRRQDTIGSHKPTWCHALTVQQRPQKHMLAPAI